MGGRGGKGTRFISAVAGGTLGGFLEKRPGSLDVLPDQFVIIVVLVRHAEPRSPTFKITDLNEFWGRRKLTSAFIEDLRVRSGKKHCRGSSRMCRVS